MTTMTQSRWFWAWEDEKEEAWLSEMAQKGWHFTQVAFPGRYTFEQGAPRPVAYRLDFFTDHRDKADYLQLFQDAGWEYAGEYGSWQYFRKEGQPGEAPEIFTDNDSKARKYQRVIAILVIFTPIWMVMLNNLNERSEPIYQALSFIGFLGILFYLYAMLMLIRRISQLKAQ
jgi:hypothetical protein